MTNTRIHADRKKLQAAFTKAAEALLHAQAIFLTTHERADGDDLSVVLALASELKNRGKKTCVGVKGGVPRTLKFLPGSSEVLSDTPEDFSFDTIVVSGCSTKDRTGLVLRSDLTVINFDHHPDNTLYGDINIVDPGVSSVAELAYQFFKFTGWKIDSAIATCLLTGIITDTGSFLHSNTETSTLKAAGELTSRGARSSLVAKHTFSSGDNYTSLAWSRALDNTWLDEAKSMVCSVITEEDMQAIGSPPPAVFERFVETINKVPQATFAMFLKQDGEVIKGSLRSDPQKRNGGFDVGALARLLGGGGHQFAAGFSIEGKLKKIDGPQRFVIERPSKLILE